MKIRTIKNLLYEFEYLFSDKKVNVLAFNTCNYGDYYNRIVIEKILKTPVHIVDLNLYWHGKINVLYKNKDLISGIGSILHFTDKNSIIWGTGSIYFNSAPSIQPKQVLAVRGKLTQKNLLSKGFSCPNIYGDPGLLINKYTDPALKNNINKKFKLGIIPHFSESKLSIIQELDKNPNIKIIDVMDVDNFLNDLLSCETIASSSLHGLIFSDSFQIPNKWISFSNNMFGDHFKFLDYYSSIYSSFDISKIKPLEVFSASQYTDIIKSMSLKAIDLNLDLLEDQLISYYKSA